MASAEVEYMRGNLAATANLVASDAVGAIIELEISLKRFEIRFATRFSN
jgi:hypothetical protein